MLEDTQCIWHYPLVTHVEVARKPVPPDQLAADVDYPDKDLGIKMDTLTDLPNGCPYKFEDDWLWLKVADNISETRSNDEVTFTRRSVYQGVRDADPNYYGSTPFNHNNLETCRWEIGAV